MLSFLPSMDVMASALIHFLQPYAMSLGWADRPGGRKMRDAPTAMHGGV